LTALRIVASLQAGALRPRDNAKENVTVANWALQRAYASHIHPGKAADPPLVPDCYPLKLESQFQDVVAHATSSAAKLSMTTVVFRMDDSRTHVVRELLLKLAFGQTRSPLTAMTELASRLCVFTDNRMGSSLMLTTVEESGARRRVTMYTFPEQDTLTLRTLSDEAILERLRTFVMRSALRKVARFEGKNIDSHFIQGEVADPLIGKDARSAADYWLDAFLDAEFSINDQKGTRLVAAALKSAFKLASAEEKQAVMEAAIALMADRRQAWSLEKVADKLVPEGLREAFLVVAPNQETARSQFYLDKDLLRQQINYRVFQLDTGVWVSAPFSEVGETVKLTGGGSKRTLTCRGVVIGEKVQRDKPNT